MKKKNLAFILTVNLIMNQGVALADYQPLDDSQNLVLTNDIDTMNPHSEDTIISDIHTIDVLPDSELSGDTSIVSTNNVDSESTSTTTDSMETDSSENQFSADAQNNHNIPTDDTCNFDESTSESESCETEESTSEKDSTEESDTEETTEDTSEETDSDESESDEPEEFLLEETCETELETEVAALAAEAEIAGPLVAHGNEIAENQYDWEIYGDDEIGYTYVANADGFSVPEEYREKITTVTIHEGITSIENKAFKGCSSLIGNLIIPNTVLSIGYSAFYGCSGLTGDLIIPDSVSSIGDDAFSNCSGFTGKLIIPNSVSSISNFAFHGCSGLTGDLIIPDSISSIGSSAFMGCSGLTGNLVIPDSVSSINNSAFYGCSGFTGKLIIPNSVSSISNSAFYGCSGLTGDLIIPDSISSIGSSAFKGCSGLTGNLVIPDSVSAIGESAFNGCSGFTGSLVIPDSVSVIGHYAFSRCTGLNGNLVIPNSVSSIGKNAFSSCSGLTGSLMIPDSVSSIGEEAFLGCSGLTGDLIIPDSVSSIGLQAFSNCTGFDGSLVIPDSISSIDNGTFSGCSGLTGNLIIPNSISYIGENAFARCSSLTGSLIIPDSISAIGKNAFLGCSGFTGTLNIPASISSISDHTFSGCSGFDGSLIIPNSVSSIGYGAFAGCKGFTGNLIIPDSVSSIGSNAFFNCSGFTGNLIIPNSISSIDYGTFAHCNNISGLSLPDSLISIDECAFEDCYGLVDHLVFPKNITRIVRLAFMDCHELTSISILSNQAIIESSAFYNCGIKYINYSPTTTNSNINIENGAFSNCPITIITAADDTIIPYLNDISVYSSSQYTVYYDSTNPAWRNYTKEDFEYYVANIKRLSCFQPLYTMPSPDVPGHPYEFQFENGSNGIRISDDPATSSYQYAFPCQCEYHCGASALVTINRFKDASGNILYVSDDLLIGYYQIPGHSSGASDQVVEIGTDVQNFSPANIHYDSKSGMLSFRPDNPAIDAKAYVTVSGVKYRIDYTNGEFSVTNLSGTDFPDSMNEAASAGNADVSYTSKTENIPDNLLDLENDNSILVSTDDDQAFDGNYISISPYFDQTDDVNDAALTVQNTVSDQDLLIRMYQTLLNSPGYYKLADYLDEGQQLTTLQEGYYIAGAYFINDHQMLILSVNNPDKSPNLEYASLNAYVYNVIDHKVELTSQEFLYQNLKQAASHLAVYAHGLNDITALYLEGIEHNSNDIYDFWNFDEYGLIHTALPDMEEDDRIEFLNHYGIEGSVAFDPIRSEIGLDPLFVYQISDSNSIHIFLKESTVDCLL